VSVLPEITGRFPVGVLLGAPRHQGGSSWRRQDQAVLTLGRPNSGTGRCTSARGVRGQGGGLRPRASSAAPWRYRPRRLAAVDDDLVDRDVAGVGVSRHGWGWCPACGGS
jgi:hypothetical protein